MNDAGRHNQVPGREARGAGTVRYRGTRPHGAWALGTALIAMILTGCAHRIHVRDGLISGPFVLEVPPGWEVARRVRWVHLQRVVLVPREGEATLAVERLRADPGLQDLPLDLLAEAIVGEVGRDRQVETWAFHEAEVELAGWPAVALTGRRQGGPWESDFTTVIARTQRHLLVVSLQAPRNQLPRHTLALERVMNTLVLPNAPPPPARLEAD